MVKQLPNFKELKEDLTDGLDAYDIAFKYNSSLTAVRKLIARFDLLKQDPKKETPTQWAERKRQELREYKAQNKKS